MWILAVDSTGFCLPSSIHFDLLNNIFMLRWTMTFYSIRSLCVDRLQNDLHLGIVCRSYVCNIIFLLLISLSKIFLKFCLSIMFKLCSDLYFYTNVHTYFMLLSSCKTELCILLIHDEHCVIYLSAIHFLPAVTSWYVSLFFCAYKHGFCEICLRVISCPASVRCHWLRCRTRCWTMKQ